MTELTEEEKVFFMRYFDGGSKKRSVDKEQVGIEECPAGGSEGEEKQRGKKGRGEVNQAIKPKCPLCSKLITVLPGEDPDEKVDEHMDFYCEGEGVGEKPQKSKDPANAKNPAKRPVGRPPKHPKLGEGKKGKEHSCTVCLRKYKDTRSATHPEEMSRFYSITKGFTGSLKREDILCKPCYSSFFTKKKRKEVMLIEMARKEKAQTQASAAEEEGEEQPEPADAEADSGASKRVRKCKWVGDVIERKGAKEFYPAIELDDVLFSLGDCARFKAPQSQRSYLGKITGLFQEDTPIGIIGGGKSGAVFESELKDTNSIGALERLSQVLTEKEFKERQQNGECMDNVFFCNMFYDTKTKSLHPLEPSTKQEDKLFGELMDALGNN